MLPGVCKGRFDGIFDWLYKSKMQKIVYNTYFFRNGYYWMYENRANRTRYGDPLLIASEWKGIPARIDTVTQIFWWRYNAWEIETFFFKGKFTLNIANNSQLTN